MTTSDHAIAGTPYVGRFAPTPSGPLHLGSLLTALGSYLQARASGGRWRLRVDDLDRERIVAGAESRILRQLEAHGLQWDGPVYRQSEQLDAYEDGLDRLAKQGLLYGCDCSRIRLKSESRPGPDDSVYSGRCRERALDVPDTALRLRMAGGTLHLDDVSGGRLIRDGAEEIGDFVVRRRDGQVAYQLACAIDESAMHVTEVVRGRDLLGSSFRQIYLMGLLGIRRPRYLHLPVLVDADGRKLSKQNGADAVDESSAPQNLQRALELLGLHPPRELMGAHPPELLGWAIRAWSPADLPEHPQLTV